MATEPPESDVPQTGGRDVPQIGGETELARLHRFQSAEGRPSAEKREDESRNELRRQSAYFGESISRLQRELQDQSIRYAESIRELRAEIEHLKITRFEAKRECHSIKTSLSWRLTWPLRLLRDAGLTFIRKSQQRFRLPSGRRLSSSNATVDALSPPIDFGAGYREQKPSADQQSIEHRFTDGLSRLDWSKETVLLVTHEISQSGAPTVVLNLAGALRQKYNIIFLNLQDGAPGYEFTAGSDLMIGPLRAEERSPDFLTALFQEIAARAPLKFAIVNSIVSGITLSAFWENDIAIVHLIDEFSSCIRPRGQFWSSAFYSGEQIFPAEIVRESAREELPALARTGRVLPQGIDIPPSGPQPVERERIRFDLRPAGWAADTVVILGAGAVTLGKGVDLFIACAKKVAELAPKREFRFVWIGEGLNTEPDAKYSLYVEDQIRRSELSERVVVLRTVSDMRAACLESDVLFLSSRLDPLPLVSLEAIHHAKPVVCFKSAAGIAEYLLRDPVACFGIVPFLDVESAANRIFRLIEDADLRLEVGHASSKLAKSRFCLERYVSELDEIAQECALKKQQEKADRMVISRSNLFDIGFFTCPLSPRSSRDPIRHYISAYSSGIRPRKAVPGFHPGIYGERNDTKGRDPLAHYLDSGQPPGPWSFDVIRSAPEAPHVEQSLRVGLHLHLYYREMAREIFDHLQGMNSRIDLLISVASASAAAAVQDVFSGYPQGEIDVRVFDNRGRDIGPFLTGFGEVILDRYDIIGHVHTKKSIGFGMNAESLTPASLESIAHWRRFLYANLLGGEHAMADRIIQRFSADETIGLAFPDHPNIHGWGKNFSYALDLAERLGISELLPKTTFNFPVGSMFWARTAALRPLFELGLAWDDYPLEPAPYDGSLLHAIERILAFVAEGAGFRTVLTYVAGVTR